LPELPDRISRETSCAAELGRSRNQDNAGLEELARPNAGSKQESKMIFAKRVPMATVMLGVCLTVSAAERSRAVEITLVRDGKPRATIVVAKDPTPSAHLAALELQYHIQKITGALVPVRTDHEETGGTLILVGESKQTSLLGIRSDDFRSLEYLIQMEPSAIVLIGRDWRDTEENRKELGRCTYGHALESYRNRIDYQKARLLR
jgi:hypothetical protein